MRDRAGTAGNPSREVADRPADILLAGSALASDGSVIEIDAKIQTALNDLSGVFFIDGPAVLAASGITESHAAHADTGYVQF